MEVQKPSEKCMGHEQKPRMSLILKDFEESKLTGLSCITCLKVDGSRAQPLKTGCALIDNDMVSVTLIHLQTDKDTELPLA